MDRLNIVINPPNADEAEVTLIGGTDGFGESVVLHLGNNNWAIIDCCIDPETKECLPILYLQKMGVDVKTQVKYVVCTHWHKDHIAGLSQLIKACGKDTILALSCAEDRQKFVYEFASDFDYTGRAGVLNELKKTLEEVKDKGIAIKRVEQDKLIFSSGCTLAFALSPSEGEVRRFENEIAQAMARSHKFIQAVKEKGKSINDVVEDATEIEDAFFKSVENLIDEKDVVDERLQETIGDLIQFKDANKVSKNDRCVAMLVSFGNHHIILGADLEVSELDNGWHSASKSECLKDKMANLLKIPHHGSETGYLKDFLIGFIKPGAIAKMSSWVLGAKMLPKADMVRKYFEHTSNLYITTTKLLKFKNSESNSTIRKILNEKTEDIIELIPQVGIIQSRIKISSDIDEWETIPYGSAKLLNKNIIDSLE